MLNFLCFFSVVNEHTRKGKHKQGQVSEEQNVPRTGETVVRAPENHIHDGKNTVEFAVFRIDTKGETDGCNQSDKRLPNRSIEEKDVKLGHGVAHRIYRNKPGGNFLTLRLNDRIDKSGHRTDTAGDTAGKFSAEEVADTDSGVTKTNECENKFHIFLDKA